MGRRIGAVLASLAFACTGTRGSRSASPSPVPRPATSHPSSTVIEETRADVDADEWVASLRIAPAADLPGHAEGILATGLSPWGALMGPGGGGRMIEIHPIDIREIRRMGGYAFISGTQGWGVYAFTTVDPPHGRVRVDTPDGPIDIDARGIFYYSPAPGGPSHHVHVVALDVNGGRGAAATSMNGFGTQSIEILDGTPAFAPVADDIMATAHRAWTDALQLHRREVADLVDDARQRLDDLRPGVRLQEPLLREGYSLSYASGRLAILFERTIVRRGEMGRDAALGASDAHLVAMPAILRGLHAEVGAHLAFEVVATADGRLSARWFPPSPIARYQCGQSAPPPCTFGDEIWRDVP